MAASTTVPFSQLPAHPEKPTGVITVSVDATNKSTVPPESRSLDADALVARKGGLSIGSVELRPAVKQEDKTSDKGLLDETDYTGVLECALPPPPADDRSPLVRPFSKTDLSLEAAMALSTGKFRTTWRDLPLFSDAFSVLLYTQILQKQKPGTIFDIGSASGASALFFADMLRACGFPDSRVVSMDVGNFRQGAAKDPAVPAELGISFLVQDVIKADEADSLLTAELLDKCPKPWLVIDDCHVELRGLYSRLRPYLAEGDLFVFEDTHPLGPSDYKMGVHDPSKYVTGFGEEKFRSLSESVLPIMERDGWVVASEWQDFFGYNTGGLTSNSILKKKKK
uniref:Rhamnosyl O-methyltransferase n=1 Tax=Chromera velia CCMP2878 TaxID=1169474 RepID=A0A0G4HUX8_9ALVE|eukprot:Cvel_8750.t1-p1 / transcript=Cvel_8750.t1 / gene=Cvel_8750 / organism=Chromera_velia_CCMP2878 / gene_product=hypothetical protein / transcript_product=hypothetical protein / location=Cvel_scaffold489:50613-52036(-) / protein_length=338 / sequence_SO=supercontig / SO=protein_coding / is_pseudo=false